LELISLRGVGRVRGRALFQRGFRTLRDLQKANPNDLSRIPTIGPSLALKIKEQVGAPVDVREVEGQAALGTLGEPSDPRGSRHNRGCGAGRSCTPGLGTGPECGSPRGRRPSRFWEGSPGIRNR